MTLQVPESEYIDPLKTIMTRRTTVIEVYCPPASVVTYRRRMFALPKPLVASFARKLATARRDSVGWILTSGKNEVLFTQKELESSLMHMQRMNSKNYSVFMNWLHGMHGIFDYARENEDALEIIYSTLNPSGKLTRQQRKYARKIYKQFTCTPLFMNGESTRMYMIISRVLSNIILESPQEERWMDILRREYTNETRRIARRNG